MFDHWILKECPALRSLDGRDAGVEHLRSCILELIGIVIRQQKQIEDLQDPNTVYDYE